MEALACKVGLEQEQSIHDRHKQVLRPLQQLNDKLNWRFDCTNRNHKHISFLLLVEKQENVKVLAASAQTSQAVVVSVSHGDGIAVLSTAQISPDVTEDTLENGSKELLKILLNFLGMSCGDTKQSLLTNAYLLGDDKVKL